MIPEWQQRVLDEKAELDARIEKLDAFLFRGEQKSLPGQERARLISQLEAMQSYQEALADRIRHNFS